MRSFATLLLLLFVFFQPPSLLSPAASHRQRASIFKIETPSQVRTNAGEALVSQMRRTNRSAASRDHPPSRHRSGRWSLIGGADHMSLRCSRRSSWHHRPDNTPAFSLSSLLPVEPNCLFFISASPTWIATKTNCTLDKSPLRHSIQATSQ